MLQNSAQCPRGRTRHLDNHPHGQIVFLAHASPLTIAIRCKKNMTWSLKRQSRTYMVYSAFVKLCKLHALLSIQSKGTHFFASHVLEVKAVPDVLARGMCSDELLHPGPQSLSRHCQQQLATS